MCVANSLVTGLPLHRASAVLSVMLNAQSAPLPLRLRSRVAIKQQFGFVGLFPLNDCWPEAAIATTVLAKPYKTRRRHQSRFLAQIIERAVSRRPANRRGSVGFERGERQRGDMLDPFFSNLKFESSSWTFLGVGQWPKTQLNQ